MVVVNSGPRRFRRHKWLLTIASLVVVVGIAEALLRISLFHTSAELASKDPEYYARSLDELWVYRHLFSATTPFAVGSGTADGSTETSNEFYKSWATSLVPDAELGYRRTPNVRTPATRPPTSPRAAAATTRGADRRSFSRGFVRRVGCVLERHADHEDRKAHGYRRVELRRRRLRRRSDLIHFTRLAPKCDRKDCLFLLGVIQDDLGRMLLAVRTSPKPYFTIRDETLVLHTAHIHPEALNDFFRRPPERFYLYYFLRGRLGFPIYRSLLNQTGEVRQQAVYALSQLIFREIADSSERGGSGSRSSFFRRRAIDSTRAYCRGFAQQAFPWWICRDV